VLSGVTLRIRQLDASNNRGFQLTSNDGEALAARIEKVRVILHCVVVCFCRVIWV
jgi:hypothetical protein